MEGGRKESEDRNKKAKLGASASKFRDSRRKTWRKTWLSHTTTHCAPRAVGKKVIS